MSYRIALLIHSLAGGGAERLMSQLAARWSEDYEVHLITWSAAATDGYPLPKSVRRHGLDLQRTSSNALQALAANLNRVRRLRSELLAIAPDFVLSFSDQMNIVALEAARTLAKPTWISEHSDPTKQRLSPLWEAWRRRSYPTCTGAVALTEEMAKTMQQWIPAERLRVIPPSVHPPSASRAELAGTLSEPFVDAGRKIFLYVGRLSQEKGVDVLLQAWRQIQQRLPDWQLVVVGDGEQRAALQERARGLAAVQFTGWVADPWPLVARAECFVLPSRYEGFPVALLEAMSLGIACISTECSSAIEELSADTPALVRVPVERPAELARAMIELATDSPRRTQLGTAASTVAERYRWTTIGPRWDAILHQNA